MKAAFWHDRWRNGQIGFHNEDVNALLARHWPDLGLEAEAPVFVPLCGKSLDMHWLRERGHPIVGVELSPIAIRDFFDEAGVTASLESDESFAHWTAEGFDLYCGDLFDLSEKEVSAIRGCYDRGSLVALPPDLRQRYAEHLIRILPESVTILMITLEYDPSQMSGPPHSVPPAEVEALFGPAFAVQPLWSSEWLDAPPYFRERGLETRRDHVLRLDRGERA